MSKINLDYYKNKDLYCYFVLNKLDDKIIKLLKNPENDDKIKEKEPPLYYYLLDKRNQGLFEWTDKAGVNKNSQILEISGGLGIHTETLCKKAKNVTTVCFSKVNAEIISSRLSHFDNLEIIVGNLSEIKFNKKFDCIVLSDVFELSKVFAPNEYLFVSHLKNLLTKNGTILCAVSNRYGIGKFSGGISHITGEAFDEINNYPKIPQLNSYTKRQLELAFDSVGFNNIKFYYPIPNHYENKIILSDKSLDKAKIGNKIPLLHKHYGTNPNNFINELLAVKEAIFDNRLTSIVNSYLIVAKIDTNTDNDLPYYIHYANNIMTTLTDNSCIKTALDDKGEETLDNMYEFCQQETKRLLENKIENIRYAKAKKSKNTLIMELAKGTSLNEIGLELLYDDEKFLKLGLEYKSLIYKIYPDIKYQDYTVENITLKNIACVENANTDMNMSNIFKDGDNYTIIDYDCKDSIIPINYIIAQGIFVFTIDSGHIFNEVEYLKQLGLSEQEIHCYRYIFREKNRPPQKRNI